MIKGNIVDYDLNVLEFCFVVFEVWFDGNFGVVII